LIVKHGIIRSLPVGKRFGFLKTPHDGDQFFHFNDCICGEDRLAVGLAVTWEPGVGQDGRQCAVEVDLVD
jgi:hypothetical protein